MRERLIELIGEYYAHPERFCPRMDTDQPCSGCKYDLDFECDQYGKLADHLLDNGVIVPPIGLGRTCFDIRAKCVDECRVSSVTQKADGSLKIRITNLRYRAAYEITPDEIGKTVFLTREEAEKALKEREGKI